MNEWAVNKEGAMIVANMLSSGEGCKLVHTYQRAQKLINHGEARIPGKNILEYPGYQRDTSVPWGWVQICAKWPKEEIISIMDNLFTHYILSLHASF